MIKIENYKCVVKQVWPAQTTKKGKYQQVLLFRKGYQNEFGEQVGKDQYYKVTIYNADVDKIAIEKLVNQKVMANITIMGNEIVTNQGIDYGTSFILKNCVLAPVKQNAN